MGKWQLELQTSVPEARLLSLTDERVFLRCFICLIVILYIVYIYCSVIGSCN